MEKPYVIKKEINAYKCQRCNHEWIPRVSMDELTNVVKDEPIICPKCKSPYWKSKPKNKKGEKK